MSFDSVKLEAFVATAAELGGVNIVCWHTNDFEVFCQMSIDDLGLSHIPTTLLDAAAVCNAGENCTLKQVMRCPGNFSKALQESFEIDLASQARTSDYSFIVNFISYFLHEYMR